MGRDQRREGQDPKFRGQNLHWERWGVVWRMGEIRTWGRGHRLELGKRKGSRIRAWEGLHVGVEPKLFCGSDPASCWVVVGAASSREQARPDWWLSKDYYASLTGARPRPRFDQSPDLVRLTPPLFPFPTRTFPTPQFLSLSPCWEQTSWSPTLNPSAVSPSHSSTCESRTPEASKGGGTSDCRGPGPGAGKGLGKGGDRPESLRKVDQERQRPGRGVTLLRPSCLPPHPLEPALRRPGSYGPKKGSPVVPCGLC